MDELLQSYEDAPYPGGAFPETHPDTLATAAWLAGIGPAAVEHCRYLEIGCGRGVNLVAMAVALPNSRFVGIDLSPAQIEYGRALAAELGLDNIELRAGDILEIGPTLDEFDYISAHGVYAWCPPPVQDAILSVCGDKLALRGVAFISYNVFPGWRRMLAWRDLARFGAGTGDWRSRVRDARRFVAQVAEEASAKLWQGRLQHGADLMLRMDDAYLLHEYLEPYNEPLLFSEMARRAADKGLQYLGDAGRQPALARLPPQAEKWWAETKPNRIELEQALDFFRDTGFRRSLFCLRRLELRPPEPERVFPLYLSSNCEAVSKEPDVNSEEPEEFSTDDGPFTSPRPLIKAVLVALAKATPRALSFDELCADVRRRLEAENDPELTEGILGAAALNCWAANLILLHRWRPRFALVAGERPRATRLARLQAQRGMDVNNLRHRHVPLDEFARAVLAKLDGTRDRAALVADLVADAEAGRLSVEKDGQPLRDPATLAALLEPVLTGLAEVALVAE
jgi:SAM-dependent methyltransferase